MRHHERRHDSNAAMASTELSLMHASTSAEQRTSLGASCTTFGSGRGEAKDFRIKDSTLGLENARVCQKTKLLCPIVLFQTDDVDTLHQARLSVLCSRSRFDQVDHVHIVPHICSMFRTCLRETFAAIVSQFCLSDGESALNNLTCCAMIFSVRACDEV